MEHGVPGELWDASSCCKSLFLPPQLMDFKELLESESAPHTSADDRNFPRQHEQQEGDFSMMVLHKQNASVVIFFHHLFSPVHHSHSCLPPCHAGKLCRKGFVPGSDEQPPTPTPPPALPVLRSRRDWEGGFDPSLENWFLWDPPGKDPVSSPGWRASSSWNSMEAQLSKALLRWGLPCEGAVRDMGQAGSLLPAVSLCWEWDPGHPGELCQAGAVLPILAQHIPAAPGSADNPS